MLHSISLGKLFDTLCRQRTYIIPPLYTRSIRLSFVTAEDASNYVAGIVFLSNNKKTKDPNMFKAITISVRARQTKPANGFYSKRAEGNRPFRNSLRCVMLNAIMQILIIEF